MKTSWFLGTVALIVSVVALLLGIAAAREMPVWVQAGDHHVRISIQGNGAPAVVLETFGPANLGLELWGRLEPGIARFARVISYDHAGYWGSEPGTKPRDANQIVSELHTALRGAGVPPPYILVGYSFGGPYVRVFAGKYPNEVAGLVFVDPTQEGFLALLNKQFPEINAVSEADRLKQEEWGMQWPSLNEARSSGLPKVPITLISAIHGEGVMAHRFLPLWLDEHTKWLRQFPQAKHIVTTNSGHGVVFTEPELIVGAVHDIVEQVRSNR